MCWSGWGFVSGRRGLNCVVGTVFFFCLVPLVKLKDETPHYITQNAFGYQQLESQPAVMICVMTQFSSSEKQTV